MSETVINSNDNVDIEDGEIVSDDETMSPSLAIADEACDKSATNEPSQTISSEATKAEESKPESAARHRSKSPRKVKLCREPLSSRQRSSRSRRSRRSSASSKRSRSSNRNSRDISWNDLLSETRKDIDRLKNRRPRKIEDSAETEKQAVAKKDLDKSPTKDVSNKANGKRKDYRADKYKTSPESSSKRHATSNNPADRYINDNICIKYLEGHCTEENCRLLHKSQNFQNAKKREICKFYLLDSCVKQSKCFYMHSDFPCKYYYLGLTCSNGNLCKFAHGPPLTDELKGILENHIEMAPKNILGDFTRLSPEIVSSLITKRHAELCALYGHAGAPVVTKPPTTAKIPSLLDLAGVGEHYSMNANKRMLPQSLAPFNSADEQMKKAELSLINAAPKVVNDWNPLEPALNEKSVARDVNSVNYIASLTIVELRELGITADQINDLQMILRNLQKKGLNDCGDSLPPANNVATETPEIAPAKPTEISVNPLPSVIPTNELKDVPDTSPGRTTNFPFFSHGQDLDMRMLPMRMDSMANQIANANGDVDMRLNPTTDEVPTSESLKYSPGLANVIDSANLNILVPQKIIPLYSEVAHMTNNTAGHAVTDCSDDSSSDDEDKLLIDESQFSPECVAKDAVVDICSDNDADATDYDNLIEGSECSTPLHSLESGSSILEKPDTFYQDLEMIKGESDWYQELNVAQQDLVDLYLALLGKYLLTVRLEDNSIQHNFINLINANPLLILILNKLRYFVNYYGKFEQMQPLENLTLNMNDNQNFTNRIVFYDTETQHEQIEMLNLNESELYYDMFVEPAERSLSARSANEIGYVSAEWRENVELDEEDTFYDRDSDSDDGPYVHYRNYRVRNYPPNIPSYMPIDEANRLLYEMDDEDEEEDDD